MLNAIEKIKKHPMGKWYYLPNMPESKIAQIKSVAKKIISESEVVVIIGIGGSYLPHRGITELIGQKNDIKFVYAGTSTSERELIAAAKAVEGKDFSIVVISKSGETLEIKQAFNVFKKGAKVRYGTEYHDRIYAITDPSKGSLIKEAKAEKYHILHIPEGVGGRYSAFSPAGLLPIAIAGLDIEAILYGALLAKADDYVAREYARRRFEQYSGGRRVELINVFEPSAEIFVQWVQQLFAESEGKNGKGILPVQTVSTGMLHYLGQFIQQGTPMMFETIIDVPTDELNQVMQDAVSSAHETRLPVYHIQPTPSVNIQTLDEKYVGWLSFTMELAAALSAIMMGVDPFDQPGVEVYKAKARELLTTFDEEGRLNRIFNKVEKYFKK